MPNTYIDNLAHKILHTFEKMDTITFEKMDTITFEKMDTITFEKMDTINPTFELILKHITFLRSI